jgi:ABC-2 type transport system permease protein
MNLRAVRAIIRRDLTVLTASKPVLIPLVVLPAIVFVALPVLVGVLPQTFSVPGGTEVGALLDALPEDAVAGLPTDPDDALPIVMLVYLLAPMYLIVPIIVAVTIAADSIAGERERKTLEGLLLAPITDTELLVGKVAGAWIPAVASSLLGALIYGTIANIVLSPVALDPPFPNVLWVVLVLWVAPALAAASLAAVVVISARVKTFQEAYQLGGLMILPLIGLLAGQATGALVLGPGVLAALGGVFWVAAGLLLRVGARSLRRTRIGERL